MVRYNGAVLTIVILELVFAFCVGLSCILISYGLFRALSSTDRLDYSEIRPMLSRSKSNDSAVGLQRESFDSDEVRLTMQNTVLSSDSDSELDYEERVDDPTRVLDGENGLAIFRMFTNNLRVW